MLHKNLSVFFTGWALELLFQVPLGEIDVCLCFFCVSFPVQLGVMLRADPPSGQSYLSLETKLINQKTVDRGPH